MLRWEEGAVEGGKGSGEVLVGRGGAAIIAKQGWKESCVVSTCVALNHVPILFAVAALLIAQGRHLMISKNFQDHNPHISFGQHL